MNNRLTRSGAFAAAATLLATSVHAADIARVYKAPPPAPVVYNWSGFYIGGNAGYAWGNSDTYTSVVSTGGLPAASVTAINALRGPLSLSDSGFTYGAQAGINIQTGNWVWGGEVDLSSIRFSDTVLNNTNIVTAGGSRAGAFSDAFETNWLITGRGRLGFAANNWLFYGTGGLAFTNYRYTHSFRDAPAGFGPGFEDAVLNRSNVGWTAGGGIEYGYGNWSLKAEYLYVDFASKSVSAPVFYTPGAAGTFTHTADLTTQIVRLGLNYRFGGDYGKAPVTAKY